ncbi:MAG TPA: 1,4-dihydroxy-2-naphthoate polyprenyltransferase [Pseudogracilibacillus sp.]|nr:1,4-dihydroxy-2-naphthoate polyprenyltransferase [Pseudogracilibacillus sp.]
MPHKTNIREALNEKDGIQVWWRLLRPHTLTASFIPVFVGTMAAYMMQKELHIFLFIAMLLATLLIQAATNMFNEYYDYVRGLDTEKSVGISGTIVRDGIEPKIVLKIALIFFGIAILLGLIIAIATSWTIALIGALSMLVGYLYTGGPYPIAYTPLGEITSGLLMGTVIIGISYYIQTGEVTSEIILISIPIAILIGTIMLANNIRDLDNDKANGRKTVAILLGHEGAVKLFASLFIITYLWTLVLIISGILPIWSLLVFLSIPKARNVIKGYIGKTTPLEMMPAMVKTGQTNTIFGFLLGFSLLLGAFI